MVEMNYPAVTRRGPLWCVLAVLLGCLAGGTPAAAETRVLQVGFADDASMIAYPDAARLAVAAGFSYARVYVSWAEVAPRRPAAPRDPADPAYDWSYVERTLAPYTGTGLG